MSIIESNVAQELKVICDKCKEVQLIFPNCISSESAAKIIWDTGNVPLTNFK